MLIDSHCHLQLEDIPEGAIDRAVAAGVERMICVGTDASTSATALELSRLEPRISAAVGLHPHEAKHGLEQVKSLVESEVKVPQNSLVAIGECGLDYYYEHSPRDVQREVFSQQIHLAKEHDLALIIHTREAWDDTFDVLNAEGAPKRTVIHCFTGSPYEARICLDLGFYISFSGIVTFPKAHEIQEAARFCPLDRMLIETDSPYLAPVPYRGKANEPAWLVQVAMFISEQKNIQMDSFAEAVSKATCQAFNLH